MQNLIKSTFLPFLGRFLLLEVTTSQNQILMHLVRLKKRFNVRFLDLHPFSVFWNNASPL